MPKSPFIAFTLDTRDVMKQVRGQIDTKLGKRLDFWATHVNKSMERREGLTNLHQHLTAETRNHVVRAYETSGFGIGKGGYRSADPGTERPGSFKRYANGAMLRALRDPQVMRSDNHRIILFDPVPLDRQARQWYRLNFGAKPAVTRNTSGPQKNMRFLNKPTNVRLSMRHLGPSEPFGMPKGYVSGSRAAQTAGAKLRKGSGAFYPKSLGPLPSPNVAYFGGRKITKGIHGKRFLDKGLTYLNREYPRQTKTLFFKWLKSGL